jgi:hypothetical protein
VKADAERRLAATTEKRRNNAENKKRAIAAGETPPAKRAKTQTGAVAKASAQSTQEEDDEDELGPVIHLPPLPAGASADFAYERVVSWVMFSCMCGNDYLGGIHGVPRRWAYAGYVELLHNDPDAHLVRIVRHPDDAKTRAPVLPAYIDYEVHERVLKYAYHMNLVAQACKTNKPAHPPAALTFQAVRELVAAKFSQVNKQAPDDERRQRMWIRLYWVYRYFACGTSNIRNIIDPLVCGWEGAWRHIIV